MYRLNSIYRKRTEIAEEISKIEKNVKNMIDTNKCYESLKIYFALNGHFPNDHYVHIPEECTVKYNNKFSNTDVEIIQKRLDGSNGINYVYCPSGFCVSINHKYFDKK